MSDSAATPPTRVLLVDDDPLVCQALELKLSSARDLKVVAAVSDGDGVVPAVHAYRPDVLLMDLRMTRVDGLTATRAVMAEPHPPRVLVLTTFDGDDEALAAVRAGAAGFLLKTESPHQIIIAVRSVAAGDGSVSDRTAGRLFAHIAGDPAAAGRRAAAEQVGRLTAREREVSAAVAQGLSNPEIARRIYVSEGTVKATLASIQAKLGLANRVAVAVVADRAGLRGLGGLTGGPSR